MKIISKIALTLLFLSCVSNFGFASDTKITKLFITNQGKEYRHTFYYDLSGKVLFETRYIASGYDGWSPQSQTEWIYSENSVSQIERTYDGAFKDVAEIVTQYNGVEKTEEITYRYVSNVRTPVKKNTFNYSGGVLSESREYIFQGGVEQLSVLNTFTYDNGKTMQQSAGVYNSGVLDSTFISTFTYDLSGNIKTQAVKKKIGSDYQNTDSITWFYDTAGKLASQRLKKWSVKNSNWENTQIINYEYDSNNLVAETYQQWAGMYWENIYRYEYLYKNDVLIKNTLKSLLYKEWRDLISINYSDFQDNKAREVSSEYGFWGGEKGEPTASYIPFAFNDELRIMQAESIRVSYNDLATNTNTSNSDLLIKVYPNPSDGIFYLSTEKHEILSWNIYNLKGQLMRSHVQTYNSGVIDITDLQDGMYILRVETTLGYQQQKLIKQK